MLKTGHGEAQELLFMTYIAIAECYEDLPTIINGEVRKRNVHRIRFDAKMGRYDMEYQVEHNGKMNGFIIWNLN